MGGLKIWIDCSGVGPLGVVFGAVIVVACGLFVSGL